MKKYLIIFFFIKIINSFINFKFGNKFIFSDKEISKEIKYNLPFYKKNLLKEIDGFYGLIGPDYYENKVDDLFEIFNKNGIIQGVFINKGKIHFIRNYIKTDKLLYEEKNGKIPMNYFTFFIFEFLKNMNLLPNIFGTANTALINFNNNLYALNERDLPYKINLFFNNKTIETNKKIKLPINNFLAHSKIKNNLLETIDYSSINQNIKIVTFDQKFKIINKIQFKKKYISMIHDFISLDKNYIFIDCPLILNTQKNMTFELNKKLNSSLFIVNKLNGNNTVINIPNLFLFHYGNYYENNNEIILYGCFYDEFYFNKPKNNQAKFRKIIINKNTLDYTIEKNNFFEKYSLDFPIVYKNYTILMNSNNLENKNFIVIKNFKLYKIINFNKNINGEASIIEIENKPYLICFTYIKNKNYLTLQGIENNYHLSVLIPFNISFGFHSIYTPVLNT